MINIQVSDEIKERHRTYIKESRIKKNIKSLLKDDYVNKQEEEFRDKHDIFCKRLLREYDNMEQGENENIFLGEPEYLYQFINHMIENFEIIHRKIQQDEKYADCLLHVFGYDSFVDSHGMLDKKKAAEEKELTLENFDNYADGFKWGAYAYVMSLKVKVCPYCNRNYVTPLYSQNGKMRADLDHFFAKKMYPYLSISLFNLVPSCKYCNSSLKGQNEFTYRGNFHPLDKIRADDLYRMTYMPENAGCFTGKENFDIDLEYNYADEMWEKMKGNNDTFKLREVYQYHKDIVSGLIKKRYVYNDGYIDYLWKSYPNLFTSREEVITFLLSPYDEIQMENVPLGKLMKDLIEEMDF